ncbi:MAG TPA: hypothetical protein VH187_22285 [Scandinavium sp.]|jgi:hypothetical protein|uniref:hypothetical protein n=1 Tax=Scandinavium sp. TaxID=2830653 RepID=UPI002E321FBA|nr:hypothetical protein [Scandinavium sp.]HEX4503864.1 hypothetical protein [Scandinavium sp.]
MFDLSWIAERIGAVPYEKRWLWVTAGEWDCLQLRGVGWLATTSINGESSRPQPDMLIREFGGDEFALGLVEQLHGICVVFDVDDAGHEGSVQFVDAFERMIHDLGSSVPVKAIDLRDISGWRENGQVEGWDVSDLLKWSRASGVLVGGQLLQAALNAGVGVEATRAKFGVDDHVSSRPDLSSTMRPGMHMVEMEDLLRLGLLYASNKASRGQGAYHLGLVASRKGWTLDELMAGGVVEKYKAAVDAEMPRDHELSAGDIKRHIERSFLNFKAIDSLNTDKANLYRLHHYFPFFVYHEGRGEALFWDGVAWHEGESKLFDHAMRLSEYIYEEAIALQNTNGDSKVVAGLFRWHKAVQSMARISSVVHGFHKSDIFRLSADLGEAWDRNGDLLGTPRGVFDLVEGKLLDGAAGRQAYCSLTTRGNILLGDEGHVRWGNDWDRGKDFWKQMLNEWQQGSGCKEVIDMLQELAGSCLRGSLLEMVVVFQGSGRSGKSAFLDALSWALGGYAHEVASDVVGSASGGGMSSNARMASIAQMDSRRMVKITEVGGKLLDVDTIKTLTGETELVGKLLYANPITVNNVASYFMMTNHELDLRGDVSEALRGRLWIVPFTTTFVHESLLTDEAYASGVVDGSVRRARDDIKGKITGKTPGWSMMPDVVLTWAWYGLARMASRSDLDRADVVELEASDLHITIAPVVKDRTASMWEATDVLGAYFAGSGLWVKGGHTIVCTSGLFANWRSWAERWDTDAHGQFDTLQKFAELLKHSGARGYEKTRGTGLMWDGTSGGERKQTNGWKVPWTFIDDKR